MRLAAISDVHGNALALDAVLADIARRGVDGIVNIGDSVAGPLMPGETADRLIALDIPTIRGNHERQMLETPREAMGASDGIASDAMTAEHCAWMRRTPATLALSDDVFLCHGTPTSDIEYLLESVDAHGRRLATRAEVAARVGDVSASLILCGHSHVPRIVRLDDGRTVVNSGSVGLQAYTWTVPVPHTVENASPHARYAILERRANGWCVEHIAIAYDWDAASRIAHRYAQAEWTQALAHGSFV